MQKVVVNISVEMEVPDAKEFGKNLSNSVDSVVSAIRAGLRDG